MNLRSIIAAAVGFFRETASDLEHEGEALRAQYRNQISYPKARNPFSGANKTGKREQDRRLRQAARIAAKRGEQP